MNFKIAPLCFAVALALSGCEDEVASDGDTPATGGKAAGEVLGGTISDDMIPLEEVTSTSPPAERRSTATVTTSSDGTQTTVETTVTDSTEPEVPAPTPPVPPATPEGQ